MFPVLCSDEKAARFNKNAKIKLFVLSVIVTVYSDFIIVLNCTFVMGRGLIVLVGAVIK